MADFLGDPVFDNGLSKLGNDADEIHLCSAQPTSYAEATSTFTLGNATPSITGPTGGGREVTVGVVSNGAVTATVIGWT